MHDHRNGYYETKELFYWRKAKERYSRAEQTIAMMGTILYANCEGITMEDAVEDACRMFRLIRANNGAIIKKNGLDLQFFGAPPTPTEEIKTT